MDLELIKRMRAEKKPTLEIASALGVSHKRLCRIMRELVANGGVKRIAPPSPRADEDNVRRLLESGLSPKEIATKLRVSLTTAYSKINKLDPSYFGARKDKRKAELAKVVELRHAGKTRKEIADTLGLPMTLIQKRISTALAKNLFRRLPSSTPRKEIGVRELGIIQRMWADNKSVQEIAAEVGWSPESAYKFLKRLVDDGVLSKRPPAYRNKINDEELRKLVAAGMSVQEMAWHFEVRTCSIYRKLRTFDPPPPKVERKRWSCFGRKEEKQ